MKQQRLRFKLIALLLFLMLGALAAYGGYSVLTYGNRWFSSRWNPRVRSQKESVIAGSILDRSGTVLAQTEDGRRVYHPDEAIRRAVVHVVGDEAGHVANSVEIFQSNYLYGFQTSLPELISSLFSGEARRGDNVTLTIDASLCAEMASALQRSSASGRGAAVAMNWRTGEVLGFVSLPAFDPAGITGDTLADAGHPFWNRAVQAVYPPGSTFKIITADAALNGIDGMEKTAVVCEGAFTVEGNRITDAGGAVHGQLSLEDAFRLSCNNVFAQLANYLGSERMLTAAKRFGFNDNFLFRDLVVANSVYPENASAFATAISGFGQGEVGVTPLHMCMIASAVANGGVMMEPRMLLRVTGPGGAERVGFSSAVYRTVTSPDNAALLKRYMRSVVTGGTGTAAAVSGMTICGKTGTAESTEDGEKINYGWFVGFNDDHDAPFAVCVLVEGIADTDGGGSTAAPAAARIFRWLGNHAENLQSAAVEAPSAEATNLVDAAKDVYDRLTTTPSPTTVPEPTEMPTITPVPEPTSIVDTVKDWIDFIDRFR